jgi:dipeptide/tripeptide permease
MVIDSRNSHHSRWKFPRAFWTENIVELFKRSAYYAVLIAITLYLSRVVGFNNIWSTWISGVFSAGMYFLPPFSYRFRNRLCADCLSAFDPTVRY